MSTATTSRFDSAPMRFMLGFAFPVLIATLVIWMDYLEGPRTAFVGVISCVTFMSAIFSKPGQTAMVGVFTVFGCYLYGLTGEDAGTMRQVIRLCLIGLAAAAAVFYSSVRVNREAERQNLIEQRIELEAKSRAGVTDQLTGTLNRHGVIDALANLESWPRFVVVLDLDKLKQINDSYGHAAGDECLAIIAQRIKRNISSKDIFGRWGGDEFILVMPIHQREAQKVVARVVAKVTDEPVIIGDHVLSPKISAGLAQWFPHNSFDEAFSLADEALYDAKQTGGNRAIVSLAS